MDQHEIQKKVKELQAIMAEHKQGLGSLEKELYNAISDYQNALEEEKLREIRTNLN